MSKRKREKYVKKKKPLRPQLTKEQLQDRINAIEQQIQYCAGSDTERINSLTDDKAELQEQLADLE